MQHDSMLCSTNRHAQFDVLLELDFRTNRRVLHSIPPTSANDLQHIFGNQQYLHPFRLRFAHTSHSGWTAFLWRHLCPSTSECRYAWTMPIWYSVWDAISRWLPFRRFLLAFAATGSASGSNDCFPFVFCTSGYESSRFLERKFLHAGTLPDFHDRSLLAFLRQEEQFFLYDLSVIFLKSNTKKPLQKL